MKDIGVGLYTSWTKLILWYIEFPAKVTKGERVIGIHHKLNWFHHRST